jgi:hypothetical protein
MIDQIIDQLLAKWDLNTLNFSTRLTKLIERVGLTSSGLLATTPSPTLALALLREAGFATLQREIESALTDAQELFAQRTVAGLPMSPSRRALATARGFASNQMTEVGNLSLASLSGLLQQAAATPIPKEDIAKQVEQIAQTSLSRARTITDTSIAGLQRATAIQAAAELPGDVVFRYSGPNDKITRPFCKRLVGKTFTPEEIRRLDNGQNLPPDLFGGGYNCRHSWQPMTRESAEILGIR